MAYNFGAITIQAIDKDDNLVGAATTLNGSTDYTKIAIGARMRLTINITATSGDVLDGEVMKCNFALFGDIQQPRLARHWQVNVNSYAPIQVFAPNLGSGQAANLNGSVKYIRTSSTVGAIQYDFRALADVEGYPPINQTNARKLTADIAGLTGETLENTGVSVYAMTKYLQCWVWVTDQYVMNGSLTYFAHPVKARFWDGVPGSSSQIGFRHITGITVDVASENDITNITRGILPVAEELPPNLSV